MSKVQDDATWGRLSGSVSPAAPRVGAFLLFFWKVGWLCLRDLVSALYSTGLVGPPLRAAIARPGSEGS